MSRDTAKILGPIGRWLVKRHSFEAKFLGGSRSVYRPESGDAPFVIISVNVQIENRNDVPTTVYIRDMAVRLTRELDRALERPVLIRPRPITVLDDLEEFRLCDVPASSAFAVEFSARRSNPPDLKEYLEDAMPEIVLTVGETFGNRHKVEGPLAFGGAYDT